MAYWRVFFMNSTVRKTLYSTQICAKRTPKLKIKLHFDNGNMVLINVVFIRHYTGADNNPGNKDSGGLYKRFTFVSINISVFNLGK